MRIMMIGRPGGGKSTFSLKLQALLNVPLYHLDRDFFLGNWVERDHQEFLDLLQNMVDEEAWIIDGNATQSFEIRYARATHCLYFNFSRLLCCCRVLKRFFVKDLKIKDRAENCPERIRLGFLRYIWTFEERVGAKLEALKLKYPDVQFIEFRSNRDVEHFQEKLVGAKS